MNTIVVPTDFSSTADNALNTAKFIARKTKATIHVASFYSLPVADYSYPEISMPSEIMEQLRKGAQEGIDKMTAALKAEGFSVESTVEMGMVADEVVSLANKVDAALIVMGTTGGGDIINKIIGSNAAHVMNHTLRPIMLVPHGYVCDSIENVIYLDELKEDDTPVLSKLFAFTGELGIENVKILNVNTGFFYQPVDEKLLTKLDEVFGLEKIKLETVDGSDIKDGIDYYLEKHQIDLVVMSTHKKTLLERIFSKNNTTQMALYSKVPLLVYHKD